MRSHAASRHSKVIAYLRLAPRSRVTAFVAAIAIVFSSVVWHYRAHLLWKINASRGTFNDIKPVPDSPMPQTDAPSDWPQYVVGDMKFYLPPELVVNHELLVDNRALTLDFRGDNYSILVSAAPDWNETGEFVSLETRLSPKQEVLTMPRLRLEFYRTSSDDFRWTMSRREVQLHIYYATMASLVRLSSIARIETLFSHDFDAIVLFGDEHASIEWQCKGSPWVGHMHFHFPDYDINPHLVRQVCQSLEPVQSNQANKGVRDKKNGTECAGIKPVWNRE